MSETTAKEEATAPDNVLLENFKILVQIISEENKLYWQRFYVFLVLHSGLFSVSFYLNGNDRIREIVFLGILGFLLSIAWLFVQCRARAYIEHWIGLAREIEEKRLPVLVLFKKECKFKASLKWFQNIPIMLVGNIIPLIFCVGWIARILIYLT